ncbi:type I methionyl aminopeptidase [Patescibacteria group bacterium]|nr:type I methionyl aminopeptidase [Patescibacteria group bacterium]MBU4057565.1 type I methionyl aminopeptidase [Patescibacteria group bacterium]MBU4115749.1 type I methionyl aminopeptidase [Patescibacteria group bacterium]
MIIKNSEELEILREGGKRLAFVVSELVKKTKVGISTIELDKLAHVLMKKQGGKPAFLNYKTEKESKPYPASVCISIDEDIVHCVPTKEKIIKDGDIVSIDLGFEYKKFITDMAYTVGVGKVDKTGKKLIKTTKTALLSGIKEAKAGNHIGDIGFVIEKIAQKNNFSVFQELVGHGVGQKLHEDPLIPNFGKKGMGEELKEGMVLAIEPMIGEGGGDIISGQDGFTYRTKDGKRSAHFEHTIVITKNGPEILTKI